jgi:hypothetical protein
MSSLNNSPRTVLRNYKRTSIAGLALIYARKTNAIRYECTYS